MTDPSYFIFRQLIATALDLDKPLVVRVINHYGNSEHSISPMNLAVINDTDQVRIVMTLRGYRLVTRSD